MPTSESNPWQNPVKKPCAWPATAPSPKPRLVCQPAEPLSAACATPLCGVPRLKATAPATAVRHVHLNLAKTNAQLATTSLLVCRHCAAGVTTAWLAENATRVPDDLAALANFLRPASGPSRASGWLAANLPHFATKRLLVPTTSTRPFVPANTGQPQSEKWHRAKRHKSCVPDAAIAKTAPAWASQTKQTVPSKPNAPAQTTAPTTAPPC